jgi:hypothetical protein
MIQHKAKKWGVEQAAEERDLLEEFLVTIERLAKDDITVIHNVKRVCGAWRKERDSIKKV